MPLRRGFVFPETRLRSEGKKYEEMFEICRTLDYNNLCISIGPGADSNNAARWLISFFKAERQFTL